MNNKIFVKISFFVITLIFIGTASASPYMLINPSAVHSTEVIYITGDGFTPYVNVTILHDLGSIYGNLNPVVLGDGTFSTSILIQGGPDPPIAGIHTIEAVTEHESAEATFEVLPGEMVVTPDNGLPGSEIVVYAHHMLYDAADLIFDLFFDNVIIGKVEQWWTDIVHSWGDSYEELPSIPMNATPGWHRIRVFAWGETLEADFCVTPDPCSISEFPTIVPPILAVFGLWFILRYKR